MLSKILIGLGLLLLIAGIVLHFFPKFPSHFRLPGDILIRKKNFTFYFPLGTSILISLLLTLILYLIQKLR